MGLAIAGPSRLLHFLTAGARSPTADDGPRSIPLSTTSGSLSSTAGTAGSHRNRPRSSPLTVGRSLGVSPAASGLCQCPATSYPRSSSLMRSCSPVPVGDRGPILGLGSSPWTYRTRSRAKASLPPRDEIGSRQHFFRWATAWKAGFGRPAASGPTAVNLRFILCHRNVSRQCPTPSDDSLAH